MRPEEERAAPVGADGTADGINLMSLPDELVAMCYAALPAKDLVSLEQVSRRMRHLVSSDALCWRKCTQERWGEKANSVLLAAAATHAETWKKLYAEKAHCDQEHAPWLIPSWSEKRAMFDLVKGDALPDRVPCASRRPTCAVSEVSNKGSASSPQQLRSSIQGGLSPRSVASVVLDPGCLSVVLLVDGSSSVTEEDFGTMKDFARELVESLRRTHPDAYVALVQFNQYPRVEVSLTNVCKSKLSSCIDTMEQMMGSTDIAAPIRRARQILIEEARPGEKAIVMLTDGQTHADELQESERETRKAAEETGARLFTLGVGRDVDEIGLSRVAAGSENGMHFTLRRPASK